MCTRPHALLSVYLQSHGYVCLEADPSHFAVIMVEMDGHNKGKDKRVEQRILRAGLQRRPGTLGANNIYARPWLLNEHDHDPEAAQMASPVPSQWQLEACALSKSQSPRLEDVRLLPTIVSATSGRPGRFLELGLPNYTPPGHSGLRSYTAALERCFGWNGTVAGVDLSTSTFCSSPSWQNMAHMRPASRCQSVAALSSNSPTVFEFAALAGDNAALSAALQAMKLDELHVLLMSANAAEPTRQLILQAGLAIPHPASPFGQDTMEGGLLQRALHRTASKLGGMQLWLRPPGQQRHWQRPL
jgi:hypothetical protein|uniref:Uncharacterized protein n=1 Tax=Haptolina ericina TaxID=156174 RepID=A0A7S3AZ64_9EUKA|mmetsp:Transcript_43415/g.98092  ORF Transcript_43415/g.98092 Transcript_43415/m.98092 type:complete len:301 (+) Transcript_43415:544-1446(+)